MPKIEFWLKKVKNEFGALVNLALDNCKRDGAFFVFLTILWSIL